MYNKLDGHLIFTLSLIYTNNQTTDEIKKDRDDIKNKLNINYLGFAEIKAILNKVLG